MGGGFLELFRFQSLIWVPRKWSFDWATVLLYFLLGCLVAEKKEGGWENDFVSFIFHVSCVVLIAEEVAISIWLLGTWREGWENGVFFLQNSCFCVVCWESWGNSVKGLSSSTYSILWQIQAPNFLSLSIPMLLFIKLELLEVSELILWMGSFLLFYPMLAFWEKFRKRK